MLSIIQLFHLSSWYIRYISDMRDQQTVLMAQLQSQSSRREDWADWSVLGQRTTSGSITCAQGSGLHSIIMAARAHPRWDDGSQRGGLTWAGQIPQKVSTPGSLSHIQHSASPMNQLEVSTWGLAKFVFFFFTLCSVQEDKWNISVE